MKLKQFMLGTTALIGAGVLVTGIALPAAAQEEGREAGGAVSAGGYPNITISGFARFRAHGGELDDQQANPGLSRNLDFSNDTEVHVLLDAQSEQTGLEYGGTIEFEADTNRTDNTDETWLFLRGGFGEVRLGDEDGVADNSSVGAQVIAAGTGGIDGSVIDTLAQGGSNVFLTNSDDATKVRYYTPSFSGFTLAASYTPQQSIVDSGSNNGDNLAGTNVEAQNVVDGGVIYDGEFGGFGILASVVGITGDLKSVDIDNDGEEDGFGGGSWWGYQAGVSTELFGFKVAGSYADEKVGDVDRRWFTAGLGYEIGPLNTSVNWSQVLDSSSRLAQNGQEIGSNQRNVVFSATYALAPGLTLDGDVGWFDNDLRGDADDDEDNVGDTGWAAVGRLALAF